MTVGPSPSYLADRARIERGETTCEAVVRRFLATIEAHNEHLNVLLAVDAEGALRQARRLDDMQAAGTLLPLHGLVVAVKDVICVEGQQTTCGSRMLADFTSLYDATAVTRLREAGAVLIGKANCDEFAMGSSNENSHFGPVRNPVDPERVPGGSSGGSAAAVAAGFCHVALGTDTGGSIRQPAAFCGVVGLKPTYGRVSRLGLVAFASSFDCLGPLAATVDECALVLAATAGEDPWDATSAQRPVPDVEDLLSGTVEGLRVGLPKEYFAEGLDAGVRQRVEEAAARLEQAGATLIEVSLPQTHSGIATYYVITMAEASSNLARYDGVRYGHRADVATVRREWAEERAALQATIDTAPDEASREAAKRALGDLGTVLTRTYAQTRAEGFGDEVKRRVLLGAYVLSAGYYDAYYAQAQRVRTLIRQDFEHAFESVDVLLTPATPTPAFKLGAKTADPVEMYLNDVYTVAASLAGIPGLVVPAGAHPASGLPVGVQLLAPWFEEGRLFAAGRVAVG